MEGGCIRQRRLGSREPFAVDPAQDLKLRPDEYFHESRCSSNGGGSALRTARRSKGGKGSKGGIFVHCQEVRGGSLSLAEEGGITRTLELSQITSRRNALFLPPPEATLMLNHLTVCNPSHSEGESYSIMSQPQLLTSCGLLVRRKHQCILIRCTKT